MKLQHVKGQLSFFQTADPPSHNRWMEQGLQLELDEQLKQEEILWRQKSRVAWLTSSDLNTKFFHASAVIRRFRNQITELKRGPNEWLSGRDTIGRGASRFLFGFV